MLVVLQGFPNSSKNIILELIAKLRLFQDLIQIKNRLSLNIKISSMVSYEYLFLSKKLSTIG
jgi:hypothetical protein